MNAPRGESEALRILREIIDGDDAALPRALEAGRKLLAALKLPPSQAQMGRSVRAVTAAQLIEIAGRDAKGETHEGIAAALGLRRHTVTYHLKPSAAMVAVCMGESITTPAPRTRRRQSAREATPA